MRTPEAKEGTRRRNPSARALLLVVAVAVLLGFAGSATAAVIITGKQIKDNTITSQDLKNDDLTGADFKNKSLTQADFDAPVVGPEGVKGPDGPAGVPGKSGLSYHVEPLSVPKNSTRSWSATCPQGSRVISGGSSSDAYLITSESAPADDAGSGWWVVMTNKTNTATNGYAWALCVTAS